MMTPVRRLGVVRRRGYRGLGQTDTGSYIDGVWVPGTGGSIDPTWGGGGGGGGATTTSGGSDLVKILQPIATAGAQIGKMFAGYANPIYSLAPGTYYQQTPYGTVVSTGGLAPSNPLAALTSSGMMPLLLLGGGFLLVMMMAKK